MRRPRQRRVAYNPAKREYIDQLTGRRLSPLVTGASPTGQHVIRVRPAPGEPMQTLEVDRLDLDPRRDSFGMQRGSRKEYIRQAKERTKGRKKKPKKRRFEADRPGIDEIIRKARLPTTFKSVDIAYGEIASKMEGQFGTGDWDEAIDCDRLIEVMDGIEVTQGWEKGGKKKKWKRLAQTKRGEDILYGEEFERTMIGSTRDGKPIYRCQGATVVVPRLIRYILGQAEGRKWRNVQWESIAEVYNALEAELGDLGAAQTSGGMGGMWVHPSVRLQDPKADLADVVWEISQDYSPRVADIVAEGLRQRELAQVAAAYKDLIKPKDKPGRARLKCIPADHRNILRHRAEVLGEWVKDPSLVPDFVCGGDGFVCTFPGLWEDVRMVREACEAPYDPKWPDELRRKYLAQMDDPGSLLFEAGLYPGDMDPAYEPSFAVTGGPVAEVEELDLPWEAAGGFEEPLEEALPWEAVGNPQRWRSERKRTPEERARTIRGLRQVRRYTDDVEAIERATTLRAIARILERDLHRFQSDVVREALAQSARNRAGELGFMCRAPGEDHEACAREIMDFVEHRQQRLANPDKTEKRRQLTAREEQEAARRLSDAKRWAAGHLHEFEITQADIDAVYPGQQRPKRRRIAPERLRSLKRKLMR